MIGHIFYFIGLIIFLLNFGIISNILTYFKAKEWVVKFSKVAGRQPLKSDFPNASLHDKFIQFNFIGIATSLWIFFGLLTGSWLVYMALILVNLILKIPVKLLGDFNIISKSIGILYSILQILVIGLLVLNHFHLHENLMKLFWSFLST